MVLFINLVEDGFVNEEHEYKYSSAKKYAGEIRQISVEIV